MHLIASSFKGKKVFITGHTGFKGTWLSLLMLEMGAVVCGVSLDASPLRFLYHKAKLEQHMTSYLFDMTDREKLASVITSFQPDIVFHLAAQPIVTESYRDPVTTYQSNVMGTVSLLHCLSLLSKPVYTLFITTDKVYADTKQEGAYTETDTLGGHDPYSASKACCEMVIDSWRRSFFPVTQFDSHQTAIAIARSGNVIGGGDMNPTRLLPSCIENILAGQPITLHNHNATRHFQYIIDVIHAYALLVAKLIEDPYTYSEPWNVASNADQAMDVVRFVKTVIAIYGKGQYIISQQQKPETEFLVLDNSKIQSKLGWIPSTSIQEAISRSVAFYKKQDQANVYRLMQQEIQYYYQEGIGRRACL